MATLKLSVNTTTERQNWWQITRKMDSHFFKRKRNKNSFFSSNKKWIPMREAPKNVRFHNFFTKSGKKRKLKLFYESSPNVTAVTVLVALRQLRDKQLKNNENNTCF